MVSEKIQECLNISEVVYKERRKLVRHFKGRGAGVCSLVWMSKESLPVVERYSDVFLLVGED